MKTFFAFPLLLALLLCGCGGSEDQAGTDSLAPQDAQDADAPNLDATPLDAAPGPDQFQPPACEAPGLRGRVLDPQDLPIGGVRLFLCGRTEGGEASCITRSTDEAGVFTFSALGAGFSHIKVNAVIAGQQSGRLFGGLTLEIDPYASPDCLALGDLLLPEFTGAQVQPTAAGAEVSLEISGLGVQVPAGALQFPDFADQDLLLVQEVPGARCPALPQGATSCFAFNPHGATVSGGATVRLRPGLFATAPSLLAYSGETGVFFEPVLFSADSGEWGWKAEAALPELTWVWILPH